MNSTEIRLALAETFSKKGCGIPYAAINAKRNGSNAVWITINGLDNTMYIVNWHKIDRNYTVAVRECLNISGSWELGDVIICHESSYAYRYAEAVFDLGCYVAGKF